jgi:hypothetical protein
MFGLFKRRTETLVADKGRVSCPSRGTDIDTDRCFDCPYVLAIVDEQDTTFVRCTPPQRKLAGRASLSLLTS